MSVSEGSWSIARNYSVEDSFDFFVCTQKFRGCGWYFMLKTLADIRECPSKGVNLMATPLEELNFFK